MLCDLWLHKTLNGSPFLAPSFHMIHMTFASNFIKFIY